jgi:hypothetical protein
MSCHMWALLGRPAVVHQDFNPPHNPSPQYGTPSHEQIQYMLADFRMGGIPSLGGRDYILRSAN